MQRIGLMIALVAVVLVATLVARSMITDTVVAKGGDDREFTNKTIKGRWGSSIQGTILSPDGPIPAVAVGLLDFDGLTDDEGLGRCVITDTTNVGGTKVGPQTSVTCTYHVNLDGTGTIEVSFGGDPAPISFVITDKKKEIRTIRTDFGVAIGVAKRQ